MKPRFSRFAAHGAVAVAALFALATTAQADLTEVGAISPDNGYPIYYGDANLLRLSLCLSNDDAGNGPLCLLPAPVNAPNPALGAFPANYGGTFPDEAFYWNGGATMAVGAGSADLIMGLEAAFFNGGVAAGDQVVFGRIRVRIDNLVPNGVYTITTPYGVYTETADAGAPGPRDINVTEDIGLVQGDFTAVLSAKVGPFLTPTDPAVGPVIVGATAYIADPNLLSAVTGSVFPVAVDFGTVATPGVANFFRVEGPRGIGVGSAEQCADPTLGDDSVATDDCIETNQFNIMGQIANNFGVQPLRTSYTRAANGNARVDVLVTSVSGMTIEASVPGRTIQLFEDPALTGRYFGRFSTNTGAVPLAADVTLTNLTDIPPTVVTSPLVDSVTVTTATFDTTSLVATGVGTLTLRANSSDNVANLSERPILQAFSGFGDALNCGGTNVIPDNTVVTCQTFAVGSVEIRSLRNPASVLGVGGGGFASQNSVITGPNVP